MENKIGMRNIKLLEKELVKTGHKFEFRVYRTPTGSLRIECPLKEIRNVIFNDMKKSYNFNGKKIGRYVISFTRK